MSSGTETEPQPSSEMGQPQENLSENISENIEKNPESYELEGQSSEKKPETFVITMTRRENSASIEEITKNENRIFPTKDIKAPIVFAGTGVLDGTIEKLKAIIDAPVIKGGSSKNRTQKRRRNQRQRKGGKSRRNVH